MYRSHQITEKLHRAIQVGQLDEAKTLVKNGAKVDQVLGLRGTALCVAIEARCYDMAKYLMETGCDVNARDFDGEPPLLLALRKALPAVGKDTFPKCHNHLTIAAMLINHPDCNLNKFDPVTKNTAIHLATKEGMVEVVRWLMDSCNATDLNVNLKDQNGNTALHLAVQTDNLQILKPIVEHQNCLCTVNTGEKTFTGYPFNLAGLSCLHLCAKKGAVEFMDVLLKRLIIDQKKFEEALFSGGKMACKVLYENLNALTVFERETCMHIACRNGHTDLVELLVKRGANIDEKDSMGNTPLLLSLVSTKQWQTMSNEIPTILLKAGADPNIKARMHNSRYVASELELNPLIISALNNNIELAKLLVTAGANVNDTDSMGRTPLYIALWENSLPVALFLLRECPDVNVNLRLRDNTTCLHALVKVTNTCPGNILRDLVKNIFARGCGLIADDKGETPVHRACEYGNHVLLDAILNEIDKGIFELPDDQVRDLLTSAASDNFIEVVQVLLSHGADMEDFDEAAPQQSCFYASLRAGHIDIARFLVEQGLDLRKHQYLQLYSSKEKTTKTRDCGNGNHKFRKDHVNGVNGVNAGVCDLDNNTSDDEESEDNDDVEEDTTSDSESDLNSCEDEIKDIVYEIGNMPDWLLESLSNPNSLELLCLINIRSQLRKAQTPFKKIKELGIPDKLVRKLRFSCKADT